MTSSRGSSSFLASSCYEEVGSTLDVAHALAADGAAAGTLVLADAQTAGRGRIGSRVDVGARRGHLAHADRAPARSAALDVLSLRVGLALAPALEPFCDERVRLKWPNDLYVGRRKLGGILVEARWRDRSRRNGSRSASGSTFARRRRVSANAAGFGRWGARVDVLAARRSGHSRRGRSRPALLDRGRAGRISPRAISRAGARCREPASGVRARNRRRAAALLVDVGSESVVGARRARSCSRRRPVILVFDVGNTEMTIGLFSEAELRGALAHHDRRRAHGRRIRRVASVADRRRADSTSDVVDSVAIGSVVPRVTQPLREACAAVFPVGEPLRRRCERRVADHACTSTSRSRSAPIA